MAPLELNTVRFIDNFSTGTRGAVSAEYFLQLGYAVIFLHRRDSRAPYTNRCIGAGSSIADWFDLTSLDSDGASHSSSSPIKLQPQFVHRVDQAVRDYAKHRNQLLLLEFLTVEDYLVQLRWLCLHLHASPNIRHGVAIYLAAAVSDFYIPRSRLPRHKLHACQTTYHHRQLEGCGGDIVSVGDGSLTVHLSPVPKVLGLISSSWAPSAFVVSFKLETDRNLLLERGQASLLKYHTHVVIANLLDTRKHEAFFITNDGGGPVCARLSVETDGGTEIEEALAKRVAALHSRFIDSKRHR